MGDNGHSDSLANYLNLHGQSSTVPTLKDFKLEIGCCPGNGVMCFLYNKAYHTIKISTIYILC